MTTNRTVNQVFTANKPLTKQMRVTVENSQVCIQGTTAAFRMLAQILLATAGGGGNTFAQGFKAQLVKTEASGFMLTPDSAERIVLHCDDKPFINQTEGAIQ